jgi:transposase
MKAPVIELDMKELEEIIERSRHGTLSAKDQEKLKELLGAMKHLMALVENKKTSMRKLRQMLFGASTEKLENLKRVLEALGDAEALGRKESKGQGKQKAKGHGRNGADAYRGAERIKIEHESLKAGDRCPGCQKGKVYVPGSPAYRIRVKGQAPIGATVYELEKLRCNLCGEMFTAPEPEGVGAEKYDASSVSMVALLKYGSGFPFHRLEGLQESLGIPLPASTQWEMVSEKEPWMAPVYHELIRQAAQGEVLHNDDTTMKILSLMRDKNREGTEEGSERTGVFTSGIIATGTGQKVALFFTGHRHAGENLAEVLQRRASQLGPPIQMCDALSRNLPKDFEVLLAHCIAHARRKFVEVAPNFPEECRYVLETLSEVYRNDAQAREEGMSAEERLRFHQDKSAPLMASFKQWLTEQIEEHKVEPNSGLGEAIAYFTKHFDKLTLFLHVTGAPLDNNLCERALKKAILHRKASLFYKTENGARVGDLYMSLIYTCQLSKTNPFDYLTELQQHHQELMQQPQDWMPWNYRQTLERAVPSDPAEE